MINGDIISGDYVTIGKKFNTKINGALRLGNCVTIADNVTIEGNNISIGDYTYISHDVTIGGGQSMNERSNVTIGKACLIVDNVLINDADEVMIGDDVGIGKEVDIWTHGGFMNVLDGYPCIVKPVSIGNHVWITSRSTILAGVTIGDDVVIGNHSLVTKDVPSGAFAGGVPCKVIKANEYPKILTREQKRQIICNVCSQYQDIMKWKGIEAYIEIWSDEDKVTFTSEHTMVVFDWEHMKVTGGGLDECVEDFRDHLRRNGIKFYTGKPFVSLPPKALN